MSAESLGVAGVRPCAGNRGATCTCPAMRCNMEDPAHLPYCSASETCSCLSDDPWRMKRAWKQRLWEVLYKSYLRGEWKPKPIDNSKDGSCPPDCPICKERGEPQHDLTASQHTGEAPDGIMDLCPACVNEQPMGWHYRGDHHRAELALRIGG